MNMKHDNCFVYTEMLGTYQAATYQGYFPKRQLPKWAISKGEAAALGPLAHL